MKDLKPEKKSGNKAQKSRIQTILKKHLSRDYPFFSSYSPYFLNETYFILLLQMISQQLKTLNHDHLLNPLRFLLQILKRLHSLPFDINYLL